MSTIRVYTRRACSYCVQAKQLLQKKGIAYEEIDLGSDPGIESSLTALTGFRTVPQIFINDRFVGGFSDLAILSAAGELDRLAQVSPR